LPRRLEDDELGFDPKTLKAKQPIATEPARANAEKRVERTDDDASQNEAVMQGRDHDDIPEDENDRVQPGYGHFDRSGF
jgi:hypothetical protein